jgi:hypothetical protein
MLRLFMLLLVAPISIAFAQNSNVLIYKDPVQVNAEVSPYAVLKEDSPITGTIMITHNTNLKVDEGTIRMGDDPLKVQFVKNVTLSSEGSLIISIYDFEMKGMKKGNYELPPISVKVGGKEYQAPALNITVEK